MQNYHDIFSPLVVEEKIHPAFKALRDSEFHAGARDLINSTYNRMGDPNGKFIRDFQSAGFHSRLFEIACYAYLESSEVDIDHSFDQPDFMITKDTVTVAIEVTAANPSCGQDRDISVANIQDYSSSELTDKCENDFPIRMSKILTSKLRHKYWELPQCVGKSLVLIVAPFFESGSVFYNDESFVEYLYGLVPKHEYKGRRIQSGFFERNECHHISAVIYCNQFTVPRFFRMAHSHPSNRMVMAIRTGTCLIPESDSTVRVAEYKYDVSDLTAPQEKWWQGTTLFHNPNALNPLPDGFLRCTSTFAVQNDYLTRTVHEFHPMTSMMYMNPVNS